MEKRTPLRFLPRSKEDESTGIARGYEESGRKQQKKWDAAYPFLVLVGAEYRDGEGKQCTGSGKVFAVELGHSRLDAGLCCELVKVEICLSRPEIRENGGD
ncbi:MAG: hypothetical protein D6679_09375 [Candidatus Hydrogenedentota bacterium]|nr:MAG: hypothetical protein D6679_09375 [Candidatus Hydrogenedentota bacterium]